MRVANSPVLQLVLPAASLIWCLTVAPMASGATVTLVPDADSYIRDDSETRGTLDFIDVRGFSSNADFVGYVRFDMSALPINSITSATLSLYKVAGSRNDGITLDRHEVQGLLSMAGNTPQDWIETGAGALNTNTVGAEYNAAPNGIDLARVVNLDPQDGANTTEAVSDALGTPTTLTGPDLVSFLNSRVGDGGLATFVITINANNDRGYGFASKENENPDLHPTLTLEYSVIPEPASGALAALALLTMAFVRGRQQRT
jgi:hypothetical protein